MPATLATLAVAGLEQLVQETLALRRNRDELQQRYHALKHAAEQEWGPVGGNDGSHTPPGPDRVHEMLEAMDARLEACVASVLFTASPTPAQQEVLREIRSRAAVVTLECIGIMMRCACAVLLSALLRVHVAALRPREV